MPGIVLKKMVALVQVALLLQKMCALRPVVTDRICASINATMQMVFLLMAAAISVQVNLDGDVEWAALLDSTSAMRSVVMEDIWASGYVTMEIISI